jgi:membrane protease YdiL (CAAX protease family)
METFVVPPPLPPPWPATLPPPATTPRAPGLGTALGFVAAYFVLQMVIGFSLSVMLAAGVALQIGFVHGTAADIGHHVRSVLAQPDTQTMLTALTRTAAACVMWRWVQRRWPPLWSLDRPPGFGFVRPARPVFFALAVVAGLSAPLLGGWLTQWLADGHPVTQDIQQLGGQAHWGPRVVLMLLLVSLGPLVEELLFRGVLLSALLRRYPAGWAIAGSSLVFALAHLPGLQWQWYALPDLLLLALVLAWLRLKSASIWPAVVAHGLNNAFAALAWFVAVKPAG